MSAERRQALIVALSARSLALAASRAGYRVVVADLFGDVDTRRLAARSIVVPGDLGRGFDGPALLEAVDRLAPAAGETQGLTYGSGLESRPDLLAELARGRRLWGNAPDVLRAIKDPGQFFPLLDRLGLPHPEIRAEPPAVSDGWLVKSVGGAGGGHVLPLGGRPTMAGAHYYQRRVAGRPVSCLFLADGRDAALLGWSEQWPEPVPAHPFRFGGGVQPASVPARVAGQIRAALAPLSAATGLVGLNSVDLMLADDGGFNVLEVNPRPGASLDIFDGEGAGALFAHHVAACEGGLKGGWRPPARATAMSVVYADRLLSVPFGMSWPAWLADRPAPGAAIEPGAPVCTVMAVAADPAAARRLARARNHGVLRALAAGDPQGLTHSLSGEEDPVAAEE